MDGGDRAALGHAWGTWGIAALIALGCSTSPKPMAQAPCGGSETCPSGFLCQDRGRGDGYRCYRDDETSGDGGVRARDGGGREVRRDDGGASGASGGQGGRGGSAAGDAATQADAGGPMPVSGSGGSAGTSTSGRGGTGSSAACTPWVLFVIDGSGSMCDAFGAVSRWTAVRNALVGADDGLMVRNETRAELGVLLFDGTIDPIAALSAVGGSPSPMCAGMYTAARMTGACPQLIAVPPARGAAQAITAVYPVVELGGSTPTDRALNAAVDQAIAAGAASKALVLISDGQPNDICMGGVGGDGSAQRFASIAAVERAYAAGIRTYVLNMAAGDPLLTAHLTEVAARGSQSDPLAKAYSPGDHGALRVALDDIMAKILACP